MGSWRIRIASLCALSPALLLGTEMNEYKVKALFLYNFAQFVEWPAGSFHDPATPFTICVLEPSPFDGELEHAVLNKAVEGRPLTIRRISEAKKSTGCQMLFVNAEQSRHFHTVLKDLKGAGLLTVGEAEGFINEGGVINFKLKGGGVHLEINISAAEREGLHISSKLLSLAEIVK